MDIGFLHLFVEDAHLWQAWFVEKLDFWPLCPPGLEGFGECAVQRDDILILLSSPRANTPTIREFLQRYGAGIADVALRVPDVEAIAHHLQCLGETLLEPIQTLSTMAGQVRWCRVPGWGSLQHTLIEMPVIGVSPSQSMSGLPWRGVDHAVLNVAAGDLEVAVRWYESRLGFVRQQRFLIETDYSGLRSVVMKHPAGSATLPINEPTSPTSQIQEFLDYHGGAGIQHVALRTQNLVETIATLRDRGIKFLAVPNSYYQQLPHRPGFWQAAGDWSAIAQQEILVDWYPSSPHTRLLQTFTQPLFGQPTFFLEFIERQTCETPQGRRQAEGFGEGNFQALFEAIEREQRQRSGLG
jgi:4-hydroxyphenylpyruvate dioxygenase